MKTFTKLALAGVGVAMIVGAQIAESPTADAAVFDICTPAMGGDNAEGVIDGTPTSCLFAANVRQAWFTQQFGNPVVAYSPVTGLNYPMICDPSNETVSGVRITGWTCHGGRNAWVVIWR